MKKLLVFVIALATVMSLQITHSALHAALPTLDLASLRAAELAKHNENRAKHGSSNLSLNDTLNQAAQTYAEYLANNHVFAHSPAASSGQYGENLYKAWGSPSLTYPPATASNSWYAESQFYNYSTFKSTDSTKAVGHFTAMVWKSVTSVGFGYAAVAENGGYAVYVVANYSPTPNVIGQYAANVSPPL